ncbi:DeoR family transcriptional regulator, partial [Escherichia coli]|nr:DeoR family transcriptional regulator [Escherichia coli]
SAQLGVSGVTIRGDLSYLEQQGYLKRSFGGAIATPLSSEPEAIQPIAPLSLAQQIAVTHRRGLWLRLSGCLSDARNEKLTLQNSLL